MVLPRNYILLKKRVKHARIRVNENLEVRIVVPLTFAKNDIDLLLRKKQKWIENNLDLFKIKRKKIILKDYEILYLGQVFKLIFSRINRVKINVGDKILYIPDQSKSTNLKKWYKKQAKELILDRVKLYSSLHKYRYSKIYIRNQRTKWGGCSSKRNLSFNWRLILCPLFVIDYIVCHELIHTRIMNHNRSFWLQMKSIYKDTERAQKWLNEYSNSIYHLTN